MFFFWQTFVILSLTGGPNAHTQVLDTQDGDVM
jgi:hypothetical protein